jgi:hypothetical protein
MKGSVPYALFVLAMYVAVLAMLCYVCCMSHPAGYFTSRPTSKGYIRQATAYLAAARQLQALAAPDLQQGRSQKQQQQQQRSAATSSAASRRSGPQQFSSSSSNSTEGLHNSRDPAVSGSTKTSSSSHSRQLSLDALGFAVSITQHHDAITGTEKQAVANDYARWVKLHA